MNNYCGFIEIWKGRKGTWMTCNPHPFNKLKSIIDERIVAIFKIKLK